MHNHDNNDVTALDYRAVVDALKNGDNPHHPLLQEIMDIPMSLTKKGAWRTADPFNLPGYITDVRLARLKKLDSYPHQIQNLIKSASLYYWNGRICPYIATKCGYAPSRRKRAMISSVLKVVLANMCFATYRVGRYFGSRFVFITVEELAEMAGFTYIDKNGTRKIETAWYRAYIAFANAYLFTHQNKRAKDVNGGAGWDVGTKIVNKKLIEHMAAEVNVSHPGALEQLEDLYVHARKWVEKKKASVSVKKQAIDAILKKSDKARDMYHQVKGRLSKLGFTSEAISHAVAAVLRVHKRNPIVFGLPATT